MDAAPRTLGEAAEAHGLAVEGGEIHEDARLCAAEVGDEDRTRCLPVRSANEARVECRLVGGKVDVRTLADNERVGCRVRPATERVGRGGRDVLEVEGLDEGAHPVLRRAAGAA